MRLRLLVLVAVLLARGLPAATTAAAGVRDGGDWDGIWRGKILAPDTRGEFGLAFTSTERGLLVSVSFPAMFLYGENFGAADIRDGVFRLPSLHLTLHHEGEVLAGTFGGGFPIELRRGEGFAAEPRAAELPPGPPPAWTVRLGAPAWASPTVRDETIYVGTTDGRMHAIGPDGRELWSWAGTHPLYGAAAVTEDRVYFVDDAEGLVALSRADGTLRWRLALHGEGAARPATASDVTFNHRTPAPVADAKGVLYVGSTDGGVYAVRARNGKVIWRHDAKTPIYAPVTLAGDGLWVAGFDGSVLQLNRRTQLEQLRVKLGGPLVSAPVIAGDRVVLGSRDCLLYGLDIKNGAAVWRDTYWFSWVESTPSVADGVLYVGGSDFRRVSAVDSATGRVQWATDVRGLSWGTPLIAGDTVYAATAGQSVPGTVIVHTGGVMALERHTGAVKWWHVAAERDGAAFTGFAGSLATVGHTVVGAGLNGDLVAFPLAYP